MLLFLLDLLANISVELSDIIIDTVQVPLQKHLQVGVLRRGRTTIASPVKTAIEVPACGHELVKEFFLDGFFLGRGDVNAFLEDATCFNLSVTKFQQVSQGFETALVKVTTVDKKDTVFIRDTRISILESTEVDLVCGDH